MSIYYIFAKEEYIDEVFNELSQLHTSVCTSIMVVDNRGIMPSKYIRVLTDVLTDVGLVDMIKKNTHIVSKNIKILKELQSRMPLV